MAKDYLEELRKYTAGGGKDLGEFLKMHTVSPQGTVSGVTQAPADVAAQLRAADSRERMGLIVAPGNVITKNAMRPISAESDALQAKIDARAPDPTRVGGEKPVQAAMSTGAAQSTFAPTPRRIAPIVEGSISAGAKQKADDTPWWQRSAFAGDPSFQKFSEDNSQARGRRERDNSLVRINRNTYIPATQNYNRNSSL